MAASRLASQLACTPLGKHWASILAVQDLSKGVTFEQTHHNLDSLPR